MRNNVPKPINVFLLEARYSLESSIPNWYIASFKVNASWGISITGIAEITCFVESTGSWMSWVFNTTERLKLNAIEIKIISHNKEQGRDSNMSVGIWTQYIL